MRYADGPGGGGARGAYFELVYDGDYMKSQVTSLSLVPVLRSPGPQESFLAMAATHDPQNIADLLHEQPFHLDTLLQVRGGGGRGGRKINVSADVRDFSSDGGAAGERRRK
eukprot:666619-Hanusia_phi.AAC.1